MGAPIKILSVDDEQDLEILLSQFFRRKIRSGEYEFYFAHNGVEALEMILEKKNFDIILSDINMPDMDGLTLLTRVHEMKNISMKCIMVSAYGDMKNIRTAMNRGAFDFATKPIDLEDLGLTIERAYEQIKYEKEISKFVSVKNEQVVAHEIREAILPHRFPPFPEFQDKVDIYATMHPAKEVGGDFYDFFKIDDEHIGFVIADVAGNGVSATLFMADCRILIHSIGMTGCSPNECIERTNRLLCLDNENKVSSTLFFGVLNVTTGEMEYVNAGHKPPYILQNDGVSDLPESSNTAIGIISEAKFLSDKCKLEQGDLIIIMSDGIMEVMRNHGELSKDDGLSKIHEKMHKTSCKDIIEFINDGLKNYIKGNEQNDDITLLAIKLL